MGLSLSTAEEIKELLTKTIREKLNSYKPETTHMPFHYRLIGRDRYAIINDVVLDPFLGSGTTAKVALELQRNVIGCEINSTFIPIIQNKISKSLFNQNCKIDIIHR